MQQHADTGADKGAEVQLIFPSNIRMGKNVILMNLTTQMTTQFT